MRKKTMVLLIMLGVVVFNDQQANASMQNKIDSFKKNTESKKEVSAKSDLNITFNYGSKDESKAIVKEVINEKEVRFIKRDNSKFYQASYYKLISNKWIHYKNSKYDYSGNRDWPYLIEDYYYYDINKAKQTNINEQVVGNGAIKYKGKSAVQKNLLKFKNGSYKSIYYKNDYRSQVDEDGWSKIVEKDKNNVLTNLHTVTRDKNFKIIKEVFKGYKNKKLVSHSVEEKDKFEARAYIYKGNILIDKFSMKLTPKLNTMKQHYYYSNGKIKQYEYGHNDIKAGFTKLVQYKYRKNKTKSSYLKTTVKNGKARAMTYYYYKYNKKGKLKSNKYGNAYNYQIKVNKKGKISKVLKAKYSNKGKKGKFSKSKLSGKEKKELIILHRNNFNVE